MQTTGPLAGVKVIEIVGIGPGPFAAMMLADLGADVLRIDRPGGSALKAAPADKDILGRNRPNAAIDLKAPGGVELVLDLIEKADIIIEGFRPGVMERLGLGPDVALARNPRLVYGRMTGWGQNGPLSALAGHDINYIGVAGGLEPIGRAGGPPQVPLNLLGDFAGGSMYLVAGVLAALTHARASGEGQVVDAAITDGVAHLLSMTVSMEQSGAWSPVRGTNLLDTGAPFYDVYETEDGGWVSVGGLEPQFWYALQQAYAADGLGDLPDRNNFNTWPDLRAALAEWFASRTRDEWAEVFSASDACVAPILPLQDAYVHPHNVARQTYVTEFGVTQPAPAPRFSGTPTAIRSAPQAPGANTREALSAWGIEQVDDLIDRKIAFQN